MYTQEAPLERKTLMLFTISAHCSAEGVVGVVVRNAAEVPHVLADQKVKVALTIAFKTTTSGLHPPATEASQTGPSAGNQALEHRSLLGVLFYNSDHRRVFTAAQQ